MPIRKFHTRGFNKSNDELIIEFLKSVGRPVPPLVITSLTGLSPSKVSQRLKQLLKYKIVRRFCRKLPLYTLRRDYNGK
jgi:DNA-binding Lrp family transcriptional regulator